MNEETYHARMTRKLTEALHPTYLEIIDDSASHHGHAGHDRRGESHFSITVVSEFFTAMNRVARHREVYRLLADELEERVHAMSLQTLTPNEYEHNL